jgi:hypothetical protein
MNEKQTAEYWKSGFTSQPDKLRALEPAKWRTQASVSKPMRGME